jgi:hypothetical protein
MTFTLSSFGGLDYKLTIWVRYLLAAAKTRQKLGIGNKKLTAILLSASWRHIDTTISKDVDAEKENKTWRKPMLWTA